ncbi:hypothetical protein H009_20916 [Agrobacterium tumefaciens str. Cherry 2E-2-2]|nr:hypothetical protein H009_20916 [Agrobacterium tumefaciens str. Cherry 2E-2-2]
MSSVGRNRPLALFLAKRREYPALRIPVRLYGLKRKMDKTGWRFDRAKRARMNLAENRCTIAMRRERLC